MLPLQTVPNGTGPELYPNRPLTTFTLLRFDGAHKWWMLAQMGLARPVMGHAPGIRFWKLMGTGHGLGFSLRPNWGVYAVLAVWDHGLHAERFLWHSRWMEHARRHAREVWTAYLLPASAHGTWNRLTPFEPSIHPAGGPIVVLTRATIRLNRLRAFWSAVPGTSAALENRDGLLLSIGIGEMPLGRQATFSVWRNEQAVRDYSYKNAAHAAAVRRTIGEDWYAEELFARFALLKSEGMWRGTDPLHE